MRWLGSSTDLTNGAGASFFTKMDAYLNGHVVVQVLVLLAMVTGLSLLVGWIKKASRPQ